MQQSADALAPSLKPLLSGAGGGAAAAAAAKRAASRKGFGGGAKSGASGSSGGGSGSTRFAVELPVADTSAAATARLAADLVRRLPAAPGGGWTAGVSDAAAAAAAASAPGVARALQLREACRADALGGALLIVAPSTAEVALVEQLLEEAWAGPAAVLLNPGWQQAGAGAAAVPKEFEALARSFEVAYSFQPIAVQGIVGAREGAVLRRPAGSGGGGGGGGAGQWQILSQQRDGRFVQVGQMKRRPAQSDLEIAFMNASAASSPLTGAVKGARGLFDALRGGKK